MPDPQRVEFITRHFEDMQTIRLAPVPAAMVLAPLAPLIPHINPGATLALLLIFLFCVVGFYWWSTAAIKRRYGSVKLSRDEAQRMMFHPAIFMLWVIGVAAMLWSHSYRPHGHGADIYMVLILSSSMLRTILDSTNPIRRRVVWAIGLVVLFSAGSFLIDVDGGAAIFVLGGAVWLSISIFDFLLLRRTFAEISASPSSGPTGAVANFG